MYTALVLALVFALSACASGGSGRGAQVPIRDVQSIAGRWSGILEASGRRQDDFIDVTLNGDGTYQAEGARTIGVLEGHGRLEVDQGRLRVTGERSTGLGTLFENDGKRTLVIQIVTANGGQFTARLTPR
jgi:hypothetical protein